eukprot:gene31286-40656_t
MSSPVVLVTGGYDHRIRFWGASSGDCSKSIPFGDSQVNCVSVSADKGIVAGGGNSLVHLFDVNGSHDERPVMSCDGHTSNVMSIGFQSDQKWLYTGSEDGSVRVWDARSNACSRKYDSGAPINTVALHPNQVELISGDQNGNVKIWDLEADKCREEFVPVADTAVRSVSISNDATTLSVGTHKGRLLVYSSGENKSWDLSKDIQAHDDYLLRCVISPHGRTIATTSADKTVKLWSSSTAGAASQGHSLSSSPVSNTSTLRDSIVNNVTWELEKTLVKHSRWVWDCVFSSDSMYLISASSDHSAKLWDLASGEVVRNYTGHNMTVSCVALNDFPTMQ